MFTLVYNFCAGEHEWEGLPERYQQYKEFIKAEIDGSIDEPTFEVVIVRAEKRSSKSVV